MKAIAVKQPSNDATGKHKVKEQTPGIAGASVFSSPDIAIQRKPSCPCGGGCPRCRGAIQAKLMINQPGDSYEQEADRAAEQVMATSVHPAASSASPHIQRFSGQSNGQMQVPASVDQALASSGRPLDPALRQDMEQRFRHDFSLVRVHSDADAGQSAQEVNANAYTVGHDMVFGAGRFAPESREGGRLLAHELAHVIQQERGGPSPPSMRGGMLEQAAESAASTFVGGQSSIRVSGASAPGLARQPLPCGEGKRPRSLKESLQVQSLTDVALAQEIRLISDWLQCNPSDSFERHQLSLGLDILESEEWQRKRKAEREQKYQEDLARVIEAVNEGRIPKWLPVFPFLPSHGLGAIFPWDWEFDAAPIMARREGDSIVVQQPVNAVRNTPRFRKDVQTLERNLRGNVFSGKGSRLRPNQLVGVRLYDEGGKVIVVYAKQLLEFAKASDKAVFKNIAATALSVPAGAVAGQVARSVAGVPFATRLFVNTATGAGLGFGTGFMSSVIVDTPDVIRGDMGIEELLSTGWESGKSGAKYGAAFSAIGTAGRAGLGKFSPNAKLGPPAGSPPPAPVMPTPPATRSGTSPAPAPAPRAVIPPATYEPPGQPTAPVPTTTTTSPTVTTSTKVVASTVAEPTAAQAARSGASPGAGFTPARRIGPLGKLYAALHITVADVAPGAQIGAGGTTGRPVPALVQPSSTIPSTGGPVVKPAPPTAAPKVTPPPAPAPAPSKTSSEVPPAVTPGPSPGAPPSAHTGTSPTPAPAPRAATSLATNEPPGQPTAPVKSTMVEPTKQPVQPTAEAVKRAEIAVTDLVTAKWGHLGVRDISDLTKAPTTPGADRLFILGKGDDAVLIEVDAKLSIQESPVVIREVSAFVTAATSGGKSRMELLDAALKKGSITPSEYEALSESVAQGVVIEEVHGFGSVSGISSELRAGQVTYVQGEQFAHIEEQLATRAVRDLSAEIKVTVVPPAADPRTAKAIAGQIWRDFEEKFQLKPPKVPHTQKKK